jgi:uncharacterized protein YqgQ
VARLKQEIGEFPKADAALKEVRGSLEEMGAVSQETFYYWAKWYHVQAKNLARGQYLQLASEVFREGIEFLEGKGSLL